MIVYVWFFISFFVLLFKINYSDDVYMNTESGVHSAAVFTVLRDVFSFLHYRNINMLRVR